ncbi:hypothetical protein FQN60_006176 [Etheostoma spectabile]|uniref:Uncharacterized protein n=1 Tax=Etheostoma spectabile TaxID=54343 RepID=A0A5J5CP44_9PERO|nr:hypothetical protein FQN60_006176 [Etheostoma spectabile]
MAAAAGSRSRAGTGGLYFLFTLLCLVCLASSLIDNKKLEDMKEKLKTAQQKLDKLKVEKDTPSELISHYMTIFEPIMALMKTTSEELPDGFPSLDGFMENTKDFIWKLKTFVDKENVAMDARIAKLQKDLEKAKNIVKALEGYQAEL